MNINPINQENSGKFRKNSEKRELNDPANVGAF